MTAEAEEMTTAAASKGYDSGGDEARGSGER